MYRKCFNCLSKAFVHNRRIHTSALINDKYENFEHPFNRTLRILSNDFKQMVRQTKRIPLDGIFPNHADIVIIGGAAVGSSIAYFLKHKTGLSGLRVVVIEKDNTYSKCSSALSLGDLRQQFSLPENVQMALFGVEFLRSLKHRFGSNADVPFFPHGSLMLASEHGAQQLYDNAKLQKQLGGINTVLSKDSLKQRYPWLNVSDVEVGCLGLEKEGWINPVTFFDIIREGAINLGAEYIQAEAIDFSFQSQQDLYIDGALTGSYEGLESVHVKLPDGTIKTIKFAYCVIAAGLESGNIAKLAKVGTGPEMLTVALPIEKRKRYVCCFNCLGDAPGLNTPLTVDYTGAYFRREGLGGTFLAGLSPTLEDESDIDTLDIGQTYFENSLRPLLEHRVPTFKNIKVRSTRGGYYDFNTFDENGIVGPHSYYYNLYFATGFGSYGIQCAPALGRAVAEHIVDGCYQTLDLTRLGFDRLLVDKPLYEICTI